jgi:hypothetical protein
MAITYTNTTYDNVVDSLHTIISDEFQIPLCYDEHKGSQSFLITPIENTLIGFLSNGQSRDYTINISYEFKPDGNYAKNSVDGRIESVVYNEDNAVLQFNCTVTE